MRILARLALLPKLLLSTSITMALLFLFTGWLVQRHAVATASQVVEREVRSSFEAYEALWRSRAAMLASVSRVLSAMSDVRAAFSTGDDATIRDTAGELWARVSDATAIFLVTDPRGRVIASLGGQTEIPLDQELPVVRAAYRLFPEQASGFMHQGAHLYQITITPVYVQSGSSPALLNVLLAGYRVDAAVVNRLKDLTGGSEFLFLAGDRVLASTLTGAQSAALVRGLSGAQEHLRANDGEREYAALTSLLRDVEGNPIAHLWIFRSFESAQQQISALRRNILLIALAAVLAGLAVTYLLARRIVEPIKTLDQAAAEVARQNFDLRVEVRSEDELGRLAATFNAMCDSIRAARVELIRQERIATIGMLATSIVHDLRNPLAAIYGSAEMLVDSDLPPERIRRLAGNLYRASQSMQQQLQDLLNLSRGRAEAVETCNLSEVITAGLEPFRSAAEEQSVRISLNVPADIELPLERARIERVFLNLMGNALDAMPGGGEVRIAAWKQDGAVLVQFSDTGPGIRPEVRKHLFQPFVSAGKKNGLGLGLALSRQALLDHGGDLWEASTPGSGASFFLRLPL